MGNALQEQGKVEEAIEAYNKALLLSPDNAKAWNNIYFPFEALKTRIGSEEDLSLLYPKDGHSHYSKVSKSILHYRLHRGQEDEEHSLTQVLELLSSADNVTIQNPAFDTSSKDQTLTLPDKMIALVHFGRSGTGLMHSLIDGHPDITTLPSIYFSEYFDHSTWEKIISAGWDQMIDRFVALYEVLFDAMSSIPVEIKSKRLLQNIGVKMGMANVGAQRNEILSVDKESVRSELRRLMAFYSKLDAFVFFKLVHAAFDKAVNDKNHKQLIFYHIHNPDLYAQLNFFQFNPGTKWIVMIREPVQSCESWISNSFAKNDHLSCVTKIILMLYEVNNVVYSKQETIGVCLEDLKQSPKKTIPAICKWMDIEEKDSLYEMTAQGKKWWGDPTSPDYSKDGMNPFGKTSINRKTGSAFSDNDQFILRTLFYPFSVRFGYTKENEEQFKKDLKTIRPMIDKMFDFEKKIIAQKEVQPDIFIKSGSYLYFRSCLIKRWETLNKFSTYPNMIKPLKIN